MNPDTSQVFNNCLVNKYKVSLTLLSTGVMATSLDMDTVFIKYLTVIVVSAIKCYALMVMTLTKGYVIQHI